METTIELDEVDSEEYKVEAICDNAVYVKESEGHLLGLYYMVLWKDYPEEENTWEPTLTVLQLRKLSSTFHHSHLDKPTATCLPINSAPLTVKPTIRPIEASSTKQKRD